MKSFRGYISEEVLPTAQVVDGSLDIEKPAVRAAINAALAGVTSQPAVTPYVVYNRISKLLAQYHIVLPRKFLEGDKGVEVFEVRQFGHRMGMTNSGEFVHEVPTTHYLFVQYGILSPMGITYAKPIVGGMYRVTARLVDKAELDKLLDVAEITMSEEAEVRQNAAKAMAPKEDPHTALGDCDCSQGDSPSTKKAVKVSMKKIDEDKDPCWKGYEMVGMKKKGGRKVPNCVPVKEEKGARIIPQTMNNPTGRDDTGSSERDRGITFVPKNTKDNNGDMPQNTLKPEGKFSNRVDPEGRRNEYAPGGTMYEKAPPGAKFERMVKHIKKGYSKDGLTKKEKGIAYATAWKAKNKESLDEDITNIKRSSRGRVFKQRLDTIVRKGLGKEGETKTVEVTRKGDPKHTARRIPKDKYDPTKYNMVRE